MIGAQKILIVDDKRENLFALEKILAPAGAEVIRAESGNEALVATLNHEFALAILDVQMPLMDGYELAEYLRNEERTKALPIIFLSAVHSDEYHIFKGYDAGAVDFITKPFDPRILLGKVNSFLQMERLKSERSQYLNRMETLVRVSGKVLAERTLEGLLRHVVDAARELTGARIAFSGYGPDRIGWSMDSSSTEPAPGQHCAEIFDLLKEVHTHPPGDRKSLRFSHKEVRNRLPMWKRDGNEQPGGLLAAPLQGKQGAEGLIVTFDKEGDDFSEEDETLLVELATLASLGLKHVEARLEADRKASQFALLSDELDQRVQERTAELERRNEELQQFAFVASHDLAEPLRKIQTFGSLLATKSADHLDEKERDYVSRMTGAANRMQELLDAVLRYSRIETSAQDFRPLRLNDIVQDAVGDLEIAIRNLGAHLEVGPLPSIKGDPCQWRQLFQNLLANAVKYHRSEVKTVIRIYGEENDGIRRIFVEDNGIGFNEKYMEKIFQPFQRLHGRNEYPGTGIGLAICKKIVERHWGTISAKSRPGEGSTFIVSLPVNQRNTI